MKDGFYGFEFVQEHNFGFGVLVFNNGRISGVDVGGACYDGTYGLADNGEVLNIALTITIPAEVESIFGIRRNSPWSFDVEAGIDAAAESGEIVLRSPVGTCLQARYRRMRDL